jgi:hypothetical protein
MSTMTHTEMHADHRAWTNEHATWHDDLRAWEKEVDLALESLEKSKAALTRHNEALRTHAAAIRLYEQRCAAHEHELARYERGQETEALATMAHGHLDETAKQDELRTVHEQTKRTHHGMIANCQLLLKLLAGDE